MSMPEVSNPFDASSGVVLVSFKAAFNVGQTNALPFLAPSLLTSSRPLKTNPARLPSCIFADLIYRG
jgi:hypothetical protein